MKQIVLLALAFLPATEMLKAQTVTAAPTALTFSWQVGAVLPPPQSVTLKVSSGTPAWTATAPTGLAPWLLVTPSSGTFPGTLTVQVNPFSLSPGVYNSSVTVVSGATTTAIAVSLTVIQPTLAPTVAPLLLAVTSAAPTGTFSISTSQAPATYSVTASPAWLSVNPTAGTVLLGGTVTLTVTATPGAMVPQAAPFVGKVTVVTSAGGVTKSQIVTVNLTVNSLPPTVTSVWPQMIAVGSPNTTVTIRGTNFFAGTTVAASTATAPLKVTVLSPVALLVTLPAPILTAAASIGLTVTNPYGGGAAPSTGVTVGSGAAILTVTNAASYATGAVVSPSLGTVSPGEIISIFGQNLGTKAGEQMTIVSGFVTTSTASGVTVTIDSVPAPIIYASDSQVNVQVPYTVTQGTGKDLVLNNGVGAPVTVKVDTTLVAPGIFTMNASGTGAAIVLNFNAALASNPFTFNSPSNPAKIGSTITMFVTGEGDYASLSYPVGGGGETGLITPTTVPAFPGGAYPQLAAPPTVTFGTTSPVNAVSVPYAGPIPTCVLGLLQVNVVIPVGTPIGTAVPMVVTIGGVPTQTVTLAIAP